MKRIFIILFITSLIFTGCASDEAINEVDDFAHCRSENINDMVSVEFLETVCVENGVCQTFFKTSNLTDCHMQVPIILFFDRDDSVFNIPANTPINYTDIIKANCFFIRSIKHREETQIYFEILEEVSFCKELNETGGTGFCSFIRCDESCCW